MLWEDYRTKLGLAFTDSQRLSRFFAVMQNELEENCPIPEEVPDDDTVYKYCNIVGVKYSDTISGSEFFTDLVSEYDNSLELFLSYYIAMMNCLDSENKDCILKLLKKSMDLAGYRFEILEDEDGYFVFPRGIPEFDDALVTQPLSWLSAYPNSHKSYIEALKMYSSPDVFGARSIADQFRKALESFFQDFFGGAKSLENYKSDYGSFLKEKGIAKEISNNLENLLDLYTKYMNNNIKHQDKAQNQLLEYIMYQTGNIIRLLIMISNP